MAKFETLDVDLYLETLADDATLRSLFPDGRVSISAETAPKDPPDVRVVYRWLDEHDVNVVGGKRAFAAASLSMEAVGRGVGMGVLRPIIERIDDIVTDEYADRQVNGTHIGRFVRTNTMRDTLTLDNIRWYTLAAVYDLIAHEHAV